MNNPTLTTYNILNNAYEHFNTSLFEGKLPHCLITVHKKRGAKAYFSGDNFVLGSDKTDEIAMNPIHFKTKSTKEILSTLVHEMCHLKQHHEGKPSRNGYHNKQWANYMKAIGLQPYKLGSLIDPDKPKKETGQRVTHMIQEGKLFDTVASDFLDKNEVILYHENEVIAKSKEKNKVKYTCPNCDANAWGSPTINIECGDCNEHMEKN